MGEKDPTNPMFEPLELFAMHSCPHGSFVHGGVEVHSSVYRSGPMATYTQQAPVCHACIYIYVDACSDVHASSRCMQYARVCTCTQRAPVRHACMCIHVCMCIYVLCAHIRAYILGTRPLRICVCSALIPRKHFTPCARLRMAEDRLIVEEAKAARVSPGHHCHCCPELRLLN